MSLDITIVERGLSKFIIGIQTLNSNLLKAVADEAVLLVGGIVWETCWGVKQVFD